MIKESISAFFPAYNDEGTIQLMVDRLNEVLGKITKTYEIIIVDDCSPDNSGKIADEIAKKDKRVRVIHHEKNKGYGGALKSGFYNSKYDLIFYTDGDAQYDVGELVKLVPYIKNYDLVNGYKNFHRADGIHRRVIGILYNYLMKLLFNIRKISEIDCDFRLMKKSIFDKIKLKANDGSICFEFALNIERGDYKVKNMRVKHFKRIYGNSQFFTPKRIKETLKKMLKNWYNLIFCKNRR